jgi:uncharacterized protein involved in response to NO
LWRREPYRLLFPLGIALAWAGVLHWLLLAVGVFTEYRSIFHSLAQIEGFMTCFASGFLFTFVPRRTGTRPPAAWQMALAMACPIAIVALAWTERWALSQLCWLLLLGNLIGFLVSRVRGLSSARSIPSFIWVPMSVAMSVIATVLAAIGASRGPEEMWLHDVGRGMILQGLFTGLVVGIGGMLIPVITRGAAFPDPGAAASRQRLFHLVLSLAFFASFRLEAWTSVPLGFGLRALIVSWALFSAARVWRPPSLPGVHRWMVWIAAWLLPLGYACVALLPAYRRAGLHVIFIGCFATMAFAVSLHVVASHSGRMDLLQGRSLRLESLALLLALALLCRLLVELDPVHFYRWLAAAAFSFLVATLVWASIVLAALSRPFVHVGSSSSAMSGR